MPVPLERNHWLASGRTAALHGAAAARRAFTLIELLVVIAVIALLVALLLPALGNARAYALTTECASNMKQVSVALLAYAADYGQCFPAFWDRRTYPNSAGPVSPDLWMTEIGSQYLGENYNTMWSPAGIMHSTIRCPADVSHCTCYGGDMGVRRTIAINGTQYACMYPPPCPSFCWDGTVCEIGCYYTCYPDGSGATMRRLSTIRYPAELALIGDGMSGTFSDEWGGTSRFFWSGCYTNGICYTASITSARHQGNLNFVYVDGHADRKSGAWVDNQWFNVGVINSRFFDWMAMYR